MNMPDRAVDRAFVAEGFVVLPEWIDYNGHMNIAFYMKTFDEALDRVYPAFGFDQAAMRAAEQSTFAAEMHVTYQRELHVGDPIRVFHRLLGFDAKRCHFIQHMHHAEEGWLAATNEWLLLYIDLRRRRVTAMPEPLQQRLAAVLGAHSRLPPPPEAGRAIGIPKRAP